MCEITSSSECVEMSIKEDGLDRASELERCGNFGDVFDLVKKSVEQSLGLRRAGLMLYLVDLPPNIGAFHIVGSNLIAVNRKLLRVAKQAGSRRIFNSYVYMILLHEYLHSLGYLDEVQTRRLTEQITIETFGSSHPAAQMATSGFNIILRKPIFTPDAVPEEKAELVRDFDRSSQTYIS